MTKSKRGGYRPNAKRPVGTTNEALGKPSVKKVQVGLYAEDFRAIASLIAAGYGENRADVVRKALREALLTRIE